MSQKISLYSRLKSKSKKHFVKRICRIHPLKDGQTHGNIYGGRSVYPKKLNKDSIVYSFGIGEDVSFDLSLISEYGMKIFAFDPTPASIDWVKHQNLPNEFIVHQYGLANHDGMVKFRKPLIENHISHSMIIDDKLENELIEFPVRRLNSITKELGHDHIDILKMDIEGAEYGVIDDIISSNLLPAQILVEFHHMFDDITAYKTIDAVRNLEGAGYVLFDIAASGYDFCFIHRSHL